MSLWVIQQWTSTDNHWTITVQIAAYCVLSSNSTVNLKISTCIATLEVNRLQSCQALPSIRQSLQRQGCQWWRLAGGGISWFLESCTSDRLLPYALQPMSHYPVKYCEICAVIETYGKYVIYMKCVKFPGTYFTKYFVKYQHSNILQNISRNIFQNKCHQNNTKYFVKIFYKLFHKVYIIFYTIHLVVFLNISHISRISHVFHRF